MTTRTPLAKITRVQSFEVPREVRVSYVDFARDYQTGSAAALAIPGTTPAVGVYEMQLAVVMGSSTAKAIAQRHLVDQLSSQVTVEFAIPIAYAYLTPGDVVRVVTDTTTYTIRLSSITIEGFSRLICVGQIDAASAREGIPYAPETDPSTFIPETGTAIANAAAAYLDIPILRDADNDAGMYAAAWPSDSNTWRGAVLYRALDDINFQAVTSWSPGYKSVAGVVTDAAAAPVYWEAWDDANSLTVTLADGAFYSDTDVNVLGGANHIAVGAAGRWEIIGFGIASDNGSGSWTLSHLLRGRRGTEHNTDSMQAGDRVVLLDTAGLRRFDTAINTIGSTYYYRPVGIGRLLVDVASESAANTGVGLKPWAPVHLRCVGGDGATSAALAWNRRTRIGGEWLDNADVPLGEASEAYEVDVLSGSTVLRTIATTDESATYTLAQYNSDTGYSAADLPTLTYRVYQLSDTVGRGYPAEITV